jgi:hypothetical protein
MNPIPVTWCAAGALAAAALGFAGGWQVNGWRHDAKQVAALAKQQAAYEKRIALIHEKAREYEQEREAARVQSTARQTEIRTIYRDVAVPAECEPPERVRDILGEAVRDANARVRGQSG